MMKKVRQLKIGTLALIMLFAFSSNAAILVNTNPINERKLIVENEKSSLELEERTFKVGDEIHYRLFLEKRSVGTITGFEADEILIKDKSGMETSIPLKRLEKIQKTNKKTRRFKRLRISINVVPLLSLVSLLMAGIASIFTWTSSCFTNQIGLIALVLTPILGVMYIFAKASLEKMPTKFSKKKDWKMKIE